MLQTILGGQTSFNAPPDWKIVQPPYHSIYERSLSGSRGRREQTTSQNFKINIVKKNVKIIQFHYCIKISIENALRSVWGLSFRWSMMIVENTYLTNLHNESRYKW